MISRILDRLFGKRYVKGWPRGVRPMFPGLRQLADLDPDLWEETRGMSPAQAFPIWFKKYPELDPEKPQAVLDGQV